MLSASSGGNPIITHSTDAKGIGEPVEEVPHSNFKEMKSLQKAINNCMLSVNNIKYYYGMDRRFLQLNSNVTK